jgi:hypothetical protein
MDNDEQKTNRYIMDIFELEAHETNASMLDICERLKRVILKTKQVSEGRGRAARLVNTLVHKTDKGTIDRIVNSYEYYKTLVEQDMNRKIEFRAYQKDIIERGARVLMERGFLYLAMEVRTGKTLTSLGIAEKIKSCKVLFVTKKKAISSIQSDYDLYNPSFTITIINYESLHLVNDDWDLVICDEAHSCFLGDTLIGGVKIKNIELGSLQKSFNFKKGIYEYKKVLNVFKNPLTENLIKIKCNGKEIICTESHKIFTKRGWVRARDIVPTDELQVL